MHLSKERPQEIGSRSLSDGGHGSPHLEAFKDVWEDSLQPAAVAGCIPDGCSAVVEDVGDEKEARNLGRGWRLSQGEGLCENLHNLSQPDP